MDVQIRLFQNGFDEGRKGDVSLLMRGAGWWALTIGCDSYVNAFEFVGGTRFDDPDLIRGIV
jgi:hypothetical protein